MSPSRNFWNILKSIDKYPPSASDAEALIEVLEAKIEVLDPYTERKYRYPSYSVTVDYNQTVEQLIENGKYEFFNDKITSDNFPSNESGVTEVIVYLVSPPNDDILCEEDVIEKLDRIGLRPATLKELLALGAAQPNLQRTNRIVALGSNWDKSADGYSVPYDGYLEVPYLDSLKSRELLLCWMEIAFMDSSWKFAAVAKRDVLVKK